MVGGQSIKITSAGGTNFNFRDIKTLLDHIKRKFDNNVRNWLISHGLGGFAQTFICMRHFSVVQRYMKEKYSGVFSCNMFSLLCYFLP